ncbi:MAG: hypothetical protein PHZ22_01530 [Bacteroidales bacterium]|nr:hypothetical protein [Bacteroidales bacterium]
MKNFKLLINFMLLCFCVFGCSKKENPPKTTDYHEVYQMYYMDFQDILKDANDKYAQLSERYSMTKSNNGFDGYIDSLGLNVIYPIDMEKLNTKIDSVFSPTCRYYIHAIFDNNQQKAISIETIGNDARLLPQEKNVLLFVLASNDVISNLLLSNNEILTKAYNKQRLEKAINRCEEQYRSDLQEVVAEAAIAGFTGCAGTPVVGITAWASVGATGYLFARRDYNRCVRYANEDYGK